MLFAATDVGVFDHKDGDGAWYKISVGMPQVPVLDVKLSGDGKYAVRGDVRPLDVEAATCPPTPPTAAAPGGSVPATLALTLGTPGAFGAVHAGRGQGLHGLDDRERGLDRRRRDAERRRPRANAPGHLVNGAFSLPQALQAKAPAGRHGRGVRPWRTPLTLLTWAGPVSNDPVTIDFKQRIGANDALRTGSYSKTLTFTLSTTNP